MADSAHLAHVGYPYVAKALRDFTIGNPVNTILLRMKAVKLAQGKPELPTLLGGGIAAAIRTMIDEGVLRVENIQVGGGKRLATQFILTRHLPG